MEKVYKFYTSKEDKIILNAVKNSPQNLREAFEQASKKINRSANAIALRYYRYLQKNQSNKLFILTSQKQCSQNYKVMRKDTKNCEIKPSKSLWRKVIDFLKTF